MGNFKLVVRNIYVNTNLEVRLKSRTTKEEANKEVERIIEKKNIFAKYEWKIEGCENGGINNFDDQLEKDIIARLEQDETDENIFWDGFTAHYDLNVAHIPVNTNLEAPLKSNSKDEALAEAKNIVAEKSIFDGYKWKIENCDEDGINDLDEALKNGITETLGKDLAACIEKCT